MGFWIYVDGERDRPRCQKHFEMRDYSQKISCYFFFEVKCGSKCDGSFQLDC
jgi:hypothetical protein